MGRVVIHHQMQLVLGIGPVDLSQEAGELLSAAIRLQCTSDLSGSDLQRGEKCCRSMSVLVNGPFINVAHPHWQQPCCAVQSLDLGFLVHTQHDSVLRWIQIQPNDVGNFSHELRVGGKFEGPTAP